MIKKCPHCGGGAVLETSQPTRDGPGVSRVVCRLCGAMGGCPRGAYLMRCASEDVSQRDGERRHDAEAIRLWNARAPDA